MRIWEKLTSLNMFPDIKKENRDALGLCRTSNICKSRIGCAKFIFAHAVEIEQIYEK